MWPRLCLITCIMADAWMVAFGIFHGNLLLFQQQMPRPLSNGEATAMLYCSTWK